MVLPLLQTALVFKEDCNEYAAKFPVSLEPDAYEKLVKALVDIDVLITIP